MPLSQVNRRRLFVLCGCLLFVVGLSFTLAGDGSSQGSADSSPTLAQVTPQALAPAQEDDELEILIIQALDQPTSLKVEDMPIRQALQRLSKNTGIPITIASGTRALLPYGSQTKILSATIEDRPLREGLTALLQPLGLEFVSTHKEVLVRATAPLSRIARRATWDELALLQRLSIQPWSKELFESLHFQFQDQPSASASVNRALIGQRAGQVGAGSAAEVLENICDQMVWTWYPSGGVIVLLPKVKQVERQLDKPVSLRYVQTSLSEALVDLTRRANISLRMDPGVLTALPPQTAERFSLSIENATVRQALEIIAGETGLSYAIEPDGIRVTYGLAATSASSAPSGSTPSQVEATAKATVAALRSNSIVGYFTVPMPDGTSFSFFVRRNDLPAEVNEMRKAKINNAINDIRQRLHAEQPQD